MSVFSLWSWRTACCVCLRAERDALPLLRTNGEPSGPDGDAHGTRGAGDDLRGRVDVVGVEVGHLALGDLPDLRLADRSDLGRVRLARALLDTGRLEDQPSRRRSLGDERERAVLVDGDLDRYDVAALGLGRGVVLLAELHDVDAVLAQRRPDRRGGGGGTGVDLELDEAGDLLLGGHVRVLRSSIPG